VHFLREKQAIQRDGALQRRWNILVLCFVALGLWSIVVTLLLFIYNYIFSAPQIIEFLLLTGLAYCGFGWWLFSTLLVALRNIPLIRFNSLKNTLAINLMGCLFNLIGLYLVSGFPRTYFFDETWKPPLVYLFCVAIAFLSTALIARVMKRRIELETR
jgi:hypothetical protein